MNTNSTAHDAALKRAADANWQILERIAGPVAIAARIAIEAEDAKEADARAAGDFETATLHAVTAEELWHGLESQIASIRGARL